MARACEKVASTAPCAADQRAQALRSQTATPSTVQAMSFRQRLRQPALSAPWTLQRRRPPARVGSTCLFYLARVLGINSVEIRASAQARWFFPTKGRTILPLVFSPCEFVDDGQPHKILIQGGGQDSNGLNPSNQAYQGGFAWLLPNGTEPCEVNAEIGVWSNGSTGAAVPNGCMALFETSSLAGTTVALPVYSITNGLQGGNAKYMISKWAGFKDPRLESDGPGKIRPCRRLPRQPKGNLRDVRRVRGRSRSFHSTSSTPTGTVFGIELTN